MEGKYLELNADDLREAYKRHSSPKEKGDIPLTEDDFVNIPEYIDEFDYVLGVNEYNGKIEIHLATETEDGYVKILTVSSKERDSLQVSKIIGISKEKFNEKYGKKIERDTGSLRGLSDESENSNPSTTAQLTAGTLSNDIIDEKPPGVKNIISDSGENYSDSQPAGVSGKNIGVSGNIFGASGQDSGVRHHTSKAEQEYIKRICDALGVKMQFVHITSKLMAKYGYNISEDSLPDGFYDKDSQTLYIGFTGYDPVKFVFKHELTHFGEGTESYKNFVDAVNESKAFKEWLVKQYGKDAENLSTAALEGKVIQQYVDRRKAYEPNFKPEDAKAEMVADFVGRCLFDNDTAALERMVSNLDYKQAETIWQHIKEFFAYLKRKLSGEKDLVWEITRLENQFNRMLSEAVQTKKATEQSGGIKFDIKKSTDGNKYVQVDGGKIETESANDIAKILSNIVRNKFNDFIDVSGQKIGINGKTAREWQRSKDAQYLLANEKQKFADKLSAFENADELLKSARDYIGEEIKHIRKDNFKEFARGVVDFKVDDRGYSADIIVGTTKTNVAILYDIVHLQEKEIEDASHTTQGRRAETSSNDIILNEESSVKNNIPDNDANNSDSGLKFTFSRALNNEKIQKAEAMEKELEGENDKRYRDMLIWEETGLIRDPSGVWVYEIDDGKMRFYPKGDRFKKRKEPRGKNLLKNYIRHKELFERYPQLNNTELVVYDFKGTGTRGSYLPEFNCIMLDKTYIETASVEEVASTLIHEIQHAAQHFDERESGANIEYWNQRLKLGTMPKNPKTGKEYTPYEAYRATRGEYEARMSSERLWMDSDEKKETFGAPFYDPENTVSTNVELAGAKPSSLKFSVPTDREYLKSVESGDNKILQQMVDNKAKAEGYTERLYHQTGADFTEFNTDNQKAGKYDWELPTGMFLKPSNDDIGLKGKKQMDLYAKQRNPLNFRDRAEAQQYWRDNVEGYDEAADKILSIDSEYRLKSDAASYEVQSYMKHWRLENPNASRQAIYNDARFQELHDKEALIFEEWEAESDKASIAAKKLIDNYIAESDYDGVVLENDVGAMGRQTKTYIVFDSSQLKDASPVTYDDSGNVIPLSERFNGDKKDIRFSIPNVLSSEEMLEAYEKGEISRQDYLNSLSNNKTLNPVEISDLTKEDANTTPKLKRKTGVSDGNKVSKFYGSVLESKIFDLEFKAEIMQDTFVEKYKSVTNKETLQRAADELDTGGRAYVNRWWTIDPAHASLIDTAVGLILMDRYQRVGDYDSAAAVTEKVREFGTSGGQQIQLFSILGRLSPETMALYAQRELDKAFEILAKDKAQKWIDQNQEKFKLSEEDIKFIREYTVLAALFDENTRQKAVLLGEISARVQNKMPPQKGDSIRAFQRNAMLLNPKTQIRNIVGNGGMVPVFIASDIIGSGIDKMLAKKTGIRTTGNFNVKSLKGVKKGLYESYDDFKLGIRTKQEELNRFDVNVKHGGKSFNDNSNGLFGTGTLKKQLNAVARGLNKIDNFTSFCLEAGDRPFFEMWYMNSLNTQMKLNNVDIPTTEMMEVARQEALQRTWQDDNTFTKSVSNLKRILNNLVHLPNSNYGLGDFVLKFVKTPSNLAKAIIEFSPAGLVSTWSNAKKLKNAIETNRFTPQLQKEYVRSLSNAITGTLIYTIIGIGAALGLVKLSGDGDDDKDASNFEKYIMGIPPYSIEFFGVPIAYDWMQPFGSILATVAEFMENRETNSELDIGDAVWEAVCAGGKTFTQQSFLQSMYEFFSGDDIIDGLVNIALAEPAAFVPQAFSQVASFTDKYRRTSYDSNSNFQTAINKIIAKIPVLRTTLPKQVNSLGEDVKNPQYFKEALGAWNAFASPWNTYPKSSKEVVGEIYKLYKDSGETSVMPRMAPNYFERSGVRINLTPEEKANFQRSMGDRSVQMLVQLFNSKEYTNLTDQQKVDIVSKIYSYSYARAKSEYDYDFETLSDILGENEDGEPILTKERYDRMSDENKKKVIEELFLSKTEIKYLDDYKKLVDYYIRKAED
ncbi:MAG: hypothetical protein J6B22_03740 [Clostridia bacterium]|nr:hypothetical protein [Clostridia bacterium]